jgi:hypothetical protein
LGKPMANQVVGIHESGCLGCDGKRSYLINYFKNDL